MRANPMRRSYSLESSTPGTIRTNTTNTTSPSPNSGRSQSSDNLKLLTKKEAEFFSCSASPTPAPRTISSYQIPPTIEKHIHATPHLLGGYLYKRRDYLRKQWRRRYFVLDRRSGVLTYYLIESAKELNDVGHEAIVKSVFLSHISIIPLYPCYRSFCLVFRLFKLSYLS